MTRTLVVSSCSRSVTWRARDRKDLVDTGLGRGVALEFAQRHHGLVVGEDRRAHVLGLGGEAGEVGAGFIEAAPRGGSDAADFGGELRVDRRARC